MGVNSLPKTVTRQRRDCDLNPGLSAPESSTLTTRLPSHPPTHPPEREHEVEKIADSTVPTCDAHAAVQQVSKKDAT